MGDDVRGIKDKSDLTIAKDRCRRIDRVELGEKEHQRRDEEHRTTQFVAGRRLAPRRD